MPRPKPQVSVSELMALVERREKLRNRIRDRRAALLRELAEVNRQLEDLGEEPAPTTSTPPLLSLDEVARLLRVDRSTVERLIGRGDLAAVNLATGTRKRLLRVTPQSLETLLASRRVRPSRPVAAWQHRGNRLPPGVIRIV